MITKSGEIIQYGLKQRAVRGVTFQPIQAAGRLEEFDPATDRLTLSEVRQMIIDQSGVFGRGYHPGSLPSGLPRYGVCP